jgi:hypothetical protein
VPQTFLRRGNSKWAKANTSIGLRLIHSAPLNARTHLSVANSQRGLPGQQYTNAVNDSDLLRRPATYPGDTCTEFIVRYFDCRETGFRLDFHPPRRLSTDNSTVLLRANNSPRLTSAACRSDESPYPSRIADREDSLTAVHECHIRLQG